MEQTSAGNLHHWRRCSSAVIMGAYLCLVFFLAFSSSPVYAQSASVTIVFESDPSRIIPLSTILQNGVVYASLIGIAETFSLRTTANHQPQSLEVFGQSYVITFYGGSTFVTLTHPTKDRAALQLPASVISSINDFFVPLAACAPVFDKLFGVTARFDRATNTLRISKAKSVFDIPMLTLEQKANGMLIRVAATKPLPDFERFLKEDGWLYVTIPNAKADLAALNKTKPLGGIKKVIATQFRNTVQLTFKIEEKFSSSEIVKDDTSHDLLITLRGATDETNVVIAERNKSVIRSELDEHRKKYGLDVIVLDAGHGGKDPGTIGVTGTKEKDVALGIVLKLGKLIKRHLKTVKVVYTRDSDRFIELDRRGQIANEEDGKLFISIHCNSMPRKPYPKRGFEVYLLRPGRTDEAIAIAERENSVIELEEDYKQRYKKLTDDNFILVTMAQSAHMKASEMFAEFTTKELGKHLDTPNNGVAQAGFLVLVGSAMPNVLVETAYLSNREDEKLLKSEGGQEKYAEAIFNAIKRYKAEYEKLLQEGKDLGTK